MECEAAFRVLLNYLIQALRDEFPDRYVECFIAEQNLVGVGMGAACRDRAVVFCSTFAAFFSRAYDQIRMGAISQSNVNLVGSHVGVSIGKKIVSNNNTFRNKRYQK